MSLFSHPPPRFSLDTASSVALEYFGLDAQIVPLTSERDQNFLLQEKSGEKYILKISNPAEDREVLHMQNRALRHAHKNDPALKIPMVIKSKNGHSIEQVEHNSESCCIRVMKYMKGKFLKDSVYTESMLYELGTLLGRLDTALAGLEKSGFQRDFPWDVRHTNFIKSHKQHLAETEMDLVDYFLEQYEKNVMPLDSTFRKAVIHNDGNDHNILIDDVGKPCGIIDFGDMVYSFIACEPAVCIAYIALEKDHPLGQMAEVLKGFHALHPLTDEELKSVIFLSCMRLCITITMAAYRKSLFPENEYITVTEDSALDFLNRLRKDNLENWSLDLMNYAKT